MWLRSPVLAELADQRVLVHACCERAEARERAAAHAAADEVTDISALVGPEKRRARAHTDDDRVLLAREGEARPTPTEGNSSTLMVFTP